MTAFPKLIDAVLQSFVACAAAMAALTTVSYLALRPGTTLLDYYGATRLLALVAFGGYFIAYLAALALVHAVGKGVSFALGRSREFQRTTTTKIVVMLQLVALGIYAVSRL